MSNGEFRIIPLIQPKQDGEKINFDLIKEICKNSLSDCPPEDRAMGWLVLLRVYPLNPMNWSTMQHEFFENYNNLIKAFNLTGWEKVRLSKYASMESFPVDDKRSFKVIHNDLIRSGRYIYFLPAATDYELEEDENETLAPFNEHIRRLERILYIFSRINVNSEYMQGFNELIGPIYYVMISAPDCFNSDLNIIEAIVFQCFTLLISETSVKQFYMTENEKKIFEKLKEFGETFSNAYPRTAHIIESLNIEPIHYSYRWFTTLFVQEYDMPVVILLWDAILTHQPNVVSYCYYLGAATIETISDKLDPDNYAETLTVLQHATKHIPNVLSVITEANEKYEEFELNIQHRKRRRWTFLSMFS